MALNCTGLDDRQGSFASYVDKLRNASDGDFTLAQQCKSQICTALWGGGNPDISGVGMSVGYICSSILGAGLAMLYLLSKRSTRIKETLVLKLLSVFDDCATFFAFSIQIACIVVLARVDYGITAVSMDDVTVRVTWTVSVLTLLPLMYTLILPGMTQPQVGGCPTKSARKASSSSSNRRDLLFSICWACSVYSFMSRMIESFGKNPIGADPDDDLTVAEWKTLQDICLAGISRISSAEDRLINAFGIMAFLILSGVAMSKILMAGIRRHYDHKMQQYQGLISKSRELVSTLKLVLVAAIPLLSVVRSYFRLQSFQATMIHTLGTQDSDGQWGFGQVVSVVVFLPVLVEACFSWYEQEKEHTEELDDLGESITMPEPHSRISNSDDADDDVSQRIVEMSPSGSTAKILRNRQTM
ncbi:hypothetical protein D6C84_09297 [Aureobasidium pullulans]|uniref:Uncharacterized protein n=1 Tax=Aureobasidium pullulans TaxID=5580 RepID=A0A4S9X837_AURPU|nr:hypothetical protein D6C84_09297 [Aureobasidium pullulans]